MPGNDGVDADRNLIQELANELQNNSTSIDDKEIILIIFKNVSH